MDISNRILRAIEQRANDPHRPYVGASSIGSPCERAIYYSYHGAPRAEFSPTTRATFDVGHKLEELMLDYVELAGMQVIRPHEMNHYLFCCDRDVPKFQGHADALLVMEDETEVILEIKTAKNSRFQVFKRKGLKEWSPSYYAQIQAYMGMKGLDKGVLLAINKDTSELHHEWVDFDSYYYNEIKAKAERIIESDEPPDRINKSPMYVVCAQCNYKDTCFFQGVNYERN